MSNNHKNDYPKSKNHKGLDPLTIKEISLMGVVAQGRIPWKEREELEDYCVLSELEYAYNMSLCQKYHFNDGTMKGYPDYQRIADELNITYHSRNKVRDRYTVRSALYRYRKKLESRIPQ